MEGEWIQAWTANPDIKRTIRDIKPSVSKRQTFDNTPVYVLRFVGAYTREKGAAP